MCVPGVSPKGSASTLGEQAGGGPLPSQGTLSTYHAPPSARPSTELPQPQQHLCALSSQAQLPHPWQHLSTPSPPAQLPPEPCSSSSSPMATTPATPSSLSQPATPSSLSEPATPSSLPQPATPSSLSHPATPSTLSQPATPSSLSHSSTSSTAPVEADTRSWGNVQDLPAESGQGLNVQDTQGPLGAPVASSSGHSNASVSPGDGCAECSGSGILPGARSLTGLQSQNVSSASGSEARGHTDAVGCRDTSGTPTARSDVSFGTNDVSTSTSTRDHDISAGAGDVSSDSGAPLSVGVPRFVEVVVEVPRGSFVKWRAEDIRQGLPTRWTVDYIGFLPCPFNYGSVPAFEALDGDPQDALVLGPRMPRGRTASIRVEALLKFVDAGIVDHKLVCKQGAVQTLGQGTGTSSSLLRPRQAGPWGGDNGGGIAALRPLFSWPWEASRKQGGGGDEGPEESDVCRECLPACPGRLGSGIALPVARRRSTVRCAICSGTMPFPRPLATSSRAGAQGVSLSATPRSRGLPARGGTHHAGGVGGGGARGVESGLVKLDLSLPQFLMITAFFRMYAACKGILNNVRGHHGSTTFCGWEVARDQL